MHPIISLGDFGECTIVGELLMATSEAYQDPVAAIRPTTRVSQPHFFRVMDAVDHTMGVSAMGRKPPLTEHPSSLQGEPAYEHCGFAEFSLV